MSWLQKLQQSVIPWLMLVVSIVTVGYVVVSSYFVFGQCSDFPEFYTSARMVWVGVGADSYVPELAKMAQNHMFPALAGRYIQLYVPPPGLTILAPIGILSPEIGYWLWMVLLVGSLAVSLYFLARIYRFEKLEFIWFLGISIFLVSTMESLRINQPAPIMLALLTGFINFSKQRKTMMAALCLTGLLLKPQQLLPIMVYCLAARQFSLVLWVLLFSSIVCGVSFVQIGMTGFQNYLAVSADSVIHNEMMVSQLCPTVRGQLLRISLLQHPVEIMKASSIVMCAAMSMIAFLGYRWKPAQGEERKWIDHCILASIPIGLVTSLHCHTYDLLLLIPPVVVLTRKRFWSVLPSLLKMLLFAAGYVFVLPVAVLIHYEYLVKGGMINPLFIALLVVAGICAYTAFISLDASKPAKAAADPKADAKSEDAENIDQSKQIGDVS